jgi:hypothetical protein
MDQNHIRKTDNERLAEIIESRSPAGRHDSVQGWHNLLKDLFSQMAPYLREGRLVTFRELKETERLFFENQLQRIKIPVAAQALYLPPSVRHQMLYQRPAGEPQPVPEHSPDNPPDEGIVLACRKNDVNVVINALLAKPPFTPAIDVYDNGQLLAGYVYHTIGECISHLSEVMQIHLQTGRPSKMTTESLASRLTSAANEHEPGS